MGGIWVPWLVDAARSTGYPVIEVPGWQNRGHGGFRVLEGVVGHHTGTAESAKGDYPSQRIVTEGRSDLPGPLCNYGLGRSGTIYVVAAGVGWHAGASRHAGFTDLNDEFLGIEAEHAGGILPWPAAELDAYVKLVAAILRYMRRGVDRYVSHRGCALPPGRKPDPKAIDDAWMRAQAARYLGGPTTAAGGVKSPVPAPAATPATPTTSSTGDDDMNGVKADINQVTGEFNELLSAEQGNGSVFSRGFISIGTAWGDADVKVTALGGNGEVWPLTGDKFLRVSNNKALARDLVPGTRHVTVEGKHLGGDLRKARLSATFIGIR